MSTWGKLRRGLAGMLLALPAACFSVGGEHAGCNAGPDGSGPCSCPEPTEVAGSAALAEGAPRRGGTVQVRIVDEPGTLLSVISALPVVQQIADHDVLEALVRFDPASGSARPELALSWERLDDGATFVFELDPEARWHDGQPLTAADVAFTFERVLDPGAGATVRERLADVSEAVAVGEHRVRITLDRPRPGLLADLSALPVLPAHLLGRGALVDSPLSRAPVGSGRFRFVSWAAGKSIELARNPSWRGEAPHVDRVVYRIVPDHRVAIDLFRRGDLDIVPGLPASSTLTAAGGRLVDFPLPRVEEWAYNTTSPVFADGAARRAVGLLIDRETIRCAVLRCRADLATSPWDRDGEPGLRFDPAAARALLVGAGWVDTDGDGVREQGGVPFEFNLVLPEVGADHRRAAMVIQQDLARAGIRMRISTVSWGAYIGRLRNRRFDATVVALPSDTERDLRGAFHSDGIADGRNFGGLADREVDALLDLLRDEARAAERERLLDLLGARLGALHPVTRTFRPRGVALVRRDVRGLELTDGLIQEHRLWLAGAAEEGR